ncbi:MAG: hypothetical protein ACOYMA_13355 [Bacteroidia bacterium]
MKITKEEILAIPAFKLVFAKETFSPYLADFISDINKGREVDIQTILGLLIKEYCNYCGISKGDRTIFYDFAGELLQQHPALWNEEEKECGYSFIDNHYKDFYPEYDNALDEYDIAILEDWQYVLYGMEFLIGYDLNEEVRPGYSYAMFNFIKNYADIFDEEIDIEQLEENLDEWIKERQ